MTDNSNNLVWMDLEMTGLFPEVDRIIEIATVITDSELNILAKGPVLALNQPRAVMDAMDDWNRSHHGNSGLTERVLNSDVSLADAEAQTLAFIKKWASPGSSPLCGNTIGQDRRFLVRYMPAVEDYLHYRNLDVSTLKELCKRWKPEVAESFHKKGAHLALDDILESIDELKHYREHFIVP